jgi:hypothetical protein
MTAVREKRENDVYMNNLGSEEGTEDLGCDTFDSDDETDDDELLHDADIVVQRKFKSDMLDFELHADDLEKVYKEVKQLFENTATIYKNDLRIGIDALRRIYESVRQLINLFREAKKRAEDGPVEDGVDDECNDRYVQPGGYPDAEDEAVEEAILDDNCPLVCTDRY